MKTVYIVLTKSGTLLSRYINKVTGAEYTHASISFSDTIQPLYSFGRKYTYLSLPSGLKKEPLTEGFYAHYSDAKLGIYTIEVSDAGYERMQSYIEGLFHDPQKWKFSVHGLAMARLGIKTNRDHKQFCSQFVANCLKASGEIELAKDSSLYHPVDFTRLDGVKCIYKGKIEDAIGRHFENKQWQ